jgi:hypothetical protein
MDSSQFANWYKLSRGFVCVAILYWFFYYFIDTNYLLILDCCSTNTILFYSSIKIFGSIELNIILDILPINVLLES